MNGGRRLGPPPTLAEIRARAAQDLKRLPQALRDLNPGVTCRVDIADALVRLAAEVDRRIAKRESTAL